MTPYLSFKKLVCLTAVLIILTPSIVKAQSTRITQDTAHITIGNHQLFIDRRGPHNGKYTVVFESGAGGTSKDWDKVRQLLPSDFPTLAYDRAGSGKSATGPLPRTMEQEVFELHVLLKTLKIKGKLIMVGQSMGGILVRLYAMHYPAQVTGLILVDPAHENGVLGSFKYGGWVRLREKATGIRIPKPQIKISASPGYDTTADYTAQEFQNLYLATNRQPKQLGNKPLIIIGAGIRNKPPGTPDEQWKQLRIERDQQVQSLSGLSSNSKFVLDEKSSHGIQNDNPPIVARAIQAIMDVIIHNKKIEWGN
jgi:pimeloyl-ACP methyl ester carboxylesterase